MKTQEDVAALIRELAALSPCDLSLRPASQADVDAFARRNGVRAPVDLREWLLSYNVLGLGTGGPFGLDPTFPAEDIEDHYESHPEWRDAGWIPIAYDSSGNYYVIDTCQMIGQTSPVYFIDHEDYGVGDYDYVVASGLWPFAWFFLHAQLRYIREREVHSPWPFAKDWVLERDPELASYAGDMPLPWD